MRLSNGYISSIVSRKEMLAFICKLMRWTSKVIFVVNAEVNFPLTPLASNALQPGVETYNMNFCHRLYSPANCQYGCLYGSGCCFAV
ncbi:hypothetical protein NL676_035576 [Syzygium grande]|nr:hypothetical protein NL676_035576 [Syzygium grande]